MKSWTRYIGIACVAGLVALWALPAPAAQKIKTIHPMTGHQKRLPEVVVQPPAGQVRWNPDGSNRFQYMQAYRDTMSACVRKIFPPRDPRAGLSAAPDEEMTSDKQILMTKCMAQTGMSAGPAMFMPPNIGAAKFHRASANMTKKYMESTEAKAIQNMTKRFDKVFAKRKKVYMERLAAAHMPKGKPFALQSSQAAAAPAEQEAPVLYVTPKPAQPTSHTEPAPEGQLWVSPRTE